MALPPSTPQSPERPLDPSNPTDLGRGLNRIDPSCELTLSADVVETLRQGGVRGLEGLSGLEAKHGKVTSLVKECVENGVFNEQELKQLRGLINDQELTPEEMAERLTELLYDVLYRHLVEIQERAEAARLVRFLRPANIPDIEMQSSSNKRPADSRDNIYGPARSAQDWISDYDKARKDGNLEYLAKCLEQVVKKKEKEKELEKKVRNKEVRDRFLGKASYPGPTVISEEQEV